MAVTGQDIGKTCRTPYERARLAVFWLGGWVVIKPPTAALASRIFGVSQTSIFRAGNDGEPIAQASTVDLLVHYWRCASPTERAEFGLEIGCGAVWDEAVVPNI